MGKKIKCSIFPKGTIKNTVLNTNGIVLDNIVIKLKSDEELSSGSYVLDGTFKIDDSLYENIVEESILKVLCDYGYEIFYITKVNKSTRYIDIVARQITIDACLGLYIEYANANETGGQGTLSHLLSNSSGIKEIELFSDIIANKSAEYEDLSLYEAIWDSDNEFISVWGGETQRRGYTAYIKQHVGINRNVSIREGRNLTGFEGCTNIDSIITRVRGKSYDGIKGNWVNSSLSDTYAISRSKTYEYKVRLREDGNKEQEGYTYFDTNEEVIAELNRLAALEFSENDVDKLKADYTVNYVQLEKTSQYKDYIASERCYIGDELQVYIPKIDIDLKVRIVKRTYDHLAQKVESIELCNYIKPSSYNISNISKQIDYLYQSQSSLFDKAKEYSSDLIKAGLQNSYVVVKENEILIMDTKDINTATKVWRWNNNGLGYSSTGYNGTYNTAITNDGKIVADFITTGILSAITIQNLSGSFVLDLSGYSGCKFYNSSKLAMAIAGNKMKFYNWGKDGDYIGSIGSINIVDSNYPSGNPNKPCIGVWNDLDSLISFSYETLNGTNGTYISLDKYNISGNGNPPISFNEKCSVKEIEVHGSEYHHNYPIYLNVENSAFIRSTTINNSEVGAQIGNSLYVDNNAYVNGGYLVNHADYAEYFEWLDGNLNNEDRTGYLVELIADKIQMANGTNILGAVSANPCLIGDAGFEYHDKYLTDNLGRYYYQDVAPTFDEEGYQIGEWHKSKTEKVLHPAYDSTLEYIPRSQRKEWSTIGLLGKLRVIDDGSCNIGEYIEARDGIAIPSKAKTRLQVMRRIDTNVIEVLVR